MARKMNFEFDCPQFFDFNSLVEDNTNGIHSLGGNSPGLEHFNLKSKNLMKNRFATWNNQLSTSVNKSPFVNSRCLNNATDSEKLTAGKKRLSKSEGSVNVVGAYSNTSKKLSYYPVVTREKSLSETDIRPKKKYPETPRKLPTTPMCLKRAQRKDKSKKLKTTEEMELDKIAELQRLTLKHIKFNEQNLKRMKMKRKPLCVPKSVPAKEENSEKSAAVKEFQKDLKTVVERLKSNRNMRFVVSNQERRTERLGAVSSDDDIELPGPSQTLLPHLSNVRNGVQENMDKNAIIIEPSFKKYQCHSGLVFHKNNIKNAVLKPFNFHGRVKDVLPEALSKSSLNIKENEMVNKVPFSQSFLSSHPRIHSKENNFGIKIAPNTDTGIGKKSFKF